MGIKSLVTDTTGQVNVNPRRIKLISYDNQATIEAAGYLNKPVLSTFPIYPTDIFDVTYDYVDATNSGTYGEYLPNIVNGIITLVSAIPPGTFLLAANNLSDVASVAASRLNLGLGTASNVTFNNLTLPNAGLHLRDADLSHTLTLSPGSNLTANRTLTLTTGDADRILDISVADVTISGFAAQYLDEPNAGATRGVLGAQEAANIKAATTADIGGGGAGPISVVVADLTAASIVVATVESSSNPVSVIACNATATGFDITFSADPGASCLVNYVAFVAAQ